LCDARIDGTAGKGGEHGHQILELPYQRIASRPDIDCQDFVERDGAQNADGNGDGVEQAGLDKRHEARPKKAPVASMTRSTSSSLIVGPMGRLSTWAWMASLMGKAPGP